MTNIRRIYRRDLHAIFKYRAALLTILALCILPSLYTLINVHAIWNPYGQNELKNIPVAVVNRDQGMRLKNRQINFGDQIVSALKKDQQIGWHFVDTKNANRRLKEGRYYAVIELPKNFSSKLTGISTGHLQKAQLIYRTNTKNSPMGIKITESAANSLLDQLKEKFAYQVNRLIFVDLNKVGKKAGQNESQILDLKSFIITLGDHLELATSSLEAINDTSNTFATALTHFRPVLSASEGVTVFDRINDADRNILNRSDRLITQSSAQLNQQLTSANQQAVEIRRLSRELANQAEKPSIAKQQIEQLVNQLKILHGQLKPLTVFFKEANKNAQLPQIVILTQLISRTDNQLEAEIVQLHDLQRQLNQGHRVTAAQLAATASKISQTVTGINVGLNHYQQRVNAELTEINNNLIKNSNESQKILTGLGKINGLNRQALNNAIKGNRLITESSGNLEAKLLAYQDDIIKLSHQLKLISNDRIADIITLLQSNPDLMGSLLAKPFEVKNEDIYKVGTFGTAFTPSYMAISIWVGCTMLAAVLHTKVKREKWLKTVNSKEEYLGKLLLFLTLSLVQTFITITLSLLVLHVHVESFFVLIFIGIISSLAFMTIVYTLAALFGNLGKAFAVMLVALQLAGSGAMYPVQLNPLIFRIMQPLFPFSYTVSGFREGIGGPNIGTVVVDSFALLIMTGIALILGLKSKRPLRRATNHLLNDFEKTGLGQ